MSGDSGQRGIRGLAGYISDLWTRSFLTLAKLGTDAWDLVLSLVDPGATVFLFDEGQAHNRLDVAFHNDTGGAWPDPNTAPATEEYSGRVQMELWDRRPCSLLPGKAHTDARNEYDTFEDPRESVYVFRHAEYTAPENGTFLVSASAFRWKYVRWRLPSVRVSEPHTWTVNRSEPSDCGVKGNSQTDWRIAHLLLYQLNHGAPPVCIHPNSRALKNALKTSTGIASRTWPDEHPVRRFFSDTGGNESAGSGGVNKLQNVAPSTQEYAKYRLNPSRNAALAYTYSRCDVSALCMLHNAKVVVPGSCGTTEAHPDNGNGAHIVVYQRTLIEVRDNQEEVYAWHSSCIKLTNRPTERTYNSSDRCWYINMQGGRLRRQLAADENDDRQGQEEPADVPPNTSTIGSSVEALESLVDMKLSRSAPIGVKRPLDGDPLKCANWPRRLCALENYETGEPFKRDTSSGTPMDVQFRLKRTDDRDSANPPTPIEFYNGMFLTLEIKTTEWFPCAIIRHPQSVEHGMPPPPQASPCMPVPWPQHNGIPTNYAVYLNPPAARRMHAVVQPDQSGGGLGFVPNPKLYFGFRSDWTSCVMGQPCQTLLGGGAQPQGGLQGGGAQLPPLDDSSGDAFGDLGPLRSTTPAPAPPPMQGPQPFTASAPAPALAEQKPTYQEAYDTYNRLRVPELKGTARSKDELNKTTWLDDNPRAKKHDLVKHLAELESGEQAPEEPEEPEALPPQAAPLPDVAPFTQGASPPGRKTRAGKKKPPLQRRMEDRWMDDMA